MPTPLVIRTVFWAWILLALTASHFLWLLRLPSLALSGLTLVLTALLVLAYRRIAAFRVWTDAIDLRALVLLHVTRFVGFYFLALYDRGALPYAFAVTGGIGSIAVAVLALLVVFLPLGEAKRHRAIYLWNIVGLFELALLIYSALRTGFSTPREIRALAVLPLSLLPTFLFPLLLATHLAIYARLASKETPP